MEHAQKDVYLVNDEIFLVNDEGSIRFKKSISEIVICFLFLLFSPHLVVSIHLRQ